MLEVICSNHNTFSVCVYQMRIKTPPRHPEARAVCHDPSRLIFSLRDPPLAWFRRVTCTCRDCFYTDEKRSMSGCHYPCRQHRPADPHQAQPIRVQCNPNANRLALASTPSHSPASPPYFPSHPAPPPRLPICLAKCVCAQLLTVIVMASRSYPQLSLEQ